MRKIILNLIITAYRRRINNLVSSNRHNLQSRIVLNCSARLDKYILAYQRNANMKMLIRTFNREHIFTKEHCSS